MQTCFTSHSYQYSETSIFVFAFDTISSVTLFSVISSLKGDKFYSRDSLFTRKVFLSVGRKVDDKCRGVDYVKKHYATKFWD